MALYILDTTILSNFSHIRRPDLVKKVLPGAVTTPQVMEELQEGVESGYVPKCDWGWLRLIELTEEEKTLAIRIRRVLQAGEASCIAVALTRGGVFLSDDGDAREYAHRHGIRVSGTLGILRKLVEEGYLPLEQADAYLAEMITAGYRAPVRSLRELSG